MNINYWLNINVMKLKMILMVILFPLNMIGSNIENSETTRVAEFVIFFYNEPFPDATVIVSVTGIGNPKILELVPDENGKVRCQVPITDTECEIVCAAYYKRDKVEYSGVAIVKFEARKGGKVQKTIHLQEM